MRRSTQLCIALSLIVASLCVGSALAGGNSTPKSQFPLEASLVGLHNCVKVGQTVTYSVKLLNTSSRIVRAKIPANGMNNDEYSFTYVSSSPVITTKTETYTVPQDDTVVTYYNRFWRVRLKPGESRLLSITGIVPDWNVIPPGANTDPTKGPVYTPEPWPVSMNFGAEVRGKANNEYMGGSSTYCGLKPPTK